MSQDECPIEVQCATKSGQPVEESLRGSSFSAEEVALLGVMMSGGLQGKTSGRFSFRHSTTRDGGKTEIISGQWRQSNVESPPEDHKDPP